jgi:hypothetical protein
VGEADDTHYVQSKDHADNGFSSSVSILQEPVQRKFEQVDTLTWKISTGVLEKIGLPDYSSLQIGPINITRHVFDDGRRSTVQVGDREASVPTSVVEAFDEANVTVEYITREFRGQIITYLEAVKPGSTMPR